MRRERNCIVSKIINKLLFTFLLYLFVQCVQASNEKIEDLYSYEDERWFNGLAIENLEALSKRYIQQCLEGENKVCSVYKSQIKQLFFKNELNEKAVEYVVEKIFPNEDWHNNGTVIIIYRYQLLLLELALEARLEHFDQILKTPQFKSAAGESGYYLIPPAYNNLKNNYLESIESICELESVAMLGGSGHLRVYLLCNVEHLNHYLKVVSETVNIIESDIYERF
jgi:hypothetical protein